MRVCCICIIYVLCTCVYLHLSKKLKKQYSLRDNHSQIVEYDLFIFLCDRLYQVQEKYIHIAKLYISYTVDTIDHVYTNDELHRIIYEYFLVS